MAWNGRNVSILGAKASEAAAAPASQEGGSAKAESPEPKKAVIAPPAPSVWNGRHTKIIAASPSKEATVAVDNVPARSASPAATVSLSTISSAASNKKELVVRSFSSKENDKDETTNSTAGSSTTNITLDEEPSTTLEGTTVTASESEKTAKCSSKESASGEKKKNAKSTPTGAPTSVRTTNNNSGTNNNRQGSQAKNASPSDASRRSGNNKAGSQRSMNHSTKQNFVRGNSGGNGRRRVSNNDTRPLCSFYARGMCNRGLACAFRHDPALSPEAGAGMPPSGNASRNNSHPTQSRPTSFAPNKRVYDPNKARAIQLAKEAQDQEDRSKYASTAKIITDEKKEEDAAPLVVEETPLFSIDVECIATGYGSCAKGINDGCGNEGRNKEGVPADQYNDRSHRYPGRVAMVDSAGNVLADVVIRPPNDGAGVVSYLTPLTGLTKEMCLGEDAKSLEEAVDAIKALLPKNGILIGQAIDHDVEWLGLTEGGKDFARMVDISEIFRQRMPAILNQAAADLRNKEEGGEQTVPVSDDKSSDEYVGFATRYRHFSLRHVCVNLLGEDIQSGVHNPITDAKYSLTLFHKYRDSSVTQLRIVRDGLHRAPITPGFAQENTPVIDGVCVSAAGYPYKTAARRIWRWYSAAKRQQS